MTWQLWIVIGFLAFSALITVAKVGKPQKPTSGTEAALTVGFAAALITLIIWAVS